MVKHYREETKITGKHRMDSLAKNVKQSFNAVVRQLIPHPKTSNSNAVGKVEKRCNGGMPESFMPPEAKRVKHTFIDEPNSDDSSSDDSRSEESSDSSLSSSYSDEDDSSPSPPKHLKKSQALQKRKTAATVQQEEEYEEDEYTVEKIINMRRDKDGKRFFLIKWLNYPSTENTWEPIENLRKCQDMVDEFLNKRNNKPNNTCKQNSKSLLKPQLQDCKVTLTKEPKLERHGEVVVISRKETSLPPMQQVVQVDPPKCSEQNLSQKLDITAPVTPVNSTSDIYIRIPNGGDIFYLRVIDDGQICWIYVDLTEPNPQAEIYYKCVVTQDLTGKQPKLIYGATTSLDGEKFCLVQFEGYSYVEIIPPENFFHKFPTFRRYFEVQCPDLFPPITQHETKK